MTIVAVNAAGAVVGTYYLRNSLALGAHRGIGSRLCQHSLQAARRPGFRAMQFNLMVTTNTAGIRRWQPNGFEVVGNLQGAIHYQRLGHVDALVMEQGLVGDLKP